MGGVKEPAKTETVPGTSITKKTTTTTTPETETSPRTTIPYETERREDKTLPKGTEKVVQEGKETVVKHVAKKTTTTDEYEIKKNEYQVIDGRDNQAKELYRVTTRTTSFNNILKIERVTRFWTFGFIDGDNKTHYSKDPQDWIQSVDKPILTDTTTKREITQGNYYNKMISDWETEKAKAAAHNANVPQTAEEALAKLLPNDSKTLTFNVIKGNDVSLEEVIKALKDDGVTIPQDAKTTLSGNTFTVTTTTTTNRDITIPGQNKIIAYNPAPTTVPTDLDDETPETNPADKNEPEVKPVDNKSTDEFVKSPDQQPTGEKTSDPQTVSESVDHVTKSGQTFTKETKVATTAKTSAQKQAQASLPQTGASSQISLSTIAGIFALALSSLAGLFAFNKKRN
jgi:LPXTG-motif cell wall-anchored protein